MIRTILRIAVAIALVVVGWAAGQAQPAAPDFEIIVNAPAGETTIECVRGCNLAWVERGVNPNATPKQTFTFACGGAGVPRCSSARVGGWVKP
jgi:hypothetical protein